MNIREKACGCIIIEDNKVLLIKQTVGHWGFPKGHVEGNESEEETALREVKEETNIDVNIFPEKRYSMQYMTDKGNLKEVVFFVAKKSSSSLKAQEEEISEIGWFDFKTALDTITYDNTKELFKTVLKDENLLK